MYILILELKITSKTGLSLYIKDYEMRHREEINNLPQYNDLIIDTSASSCKTID